MKTKLSVRTVLGVVILASCTGGGGEAGSGAGDFVDTGGHEPPPSDYDQPPGQDPPPSDYDNPSTIGSGPGSGTDGGGNPRCASLCTAIIAEGCTQLGADENTCRATCNAALPQLEPCENQYLAYFACVVASPEFTCKVLTGDGPGEFAECQGQARAYANCQQNGEGGQGGI